MKNEASGWPEVVLMRRRTVWKRCISGIHHHQSGGGGGLVLGFAVGGLGEGTKSVYWGLGHRELLGCSLKLSITVLDRVS